MMRNLSSADKASKNPPSISRKGFLAGCVVGAGLLVGVYLTFFQYEHRVGWVESYSEVAGESNTYDVGYCIGSGDTKDHKIELVSSTADEVVLRSTYAKRRTLQTETADARCGVMRVRLPESIGERKALDASGEPVNHSRL